MKSLLTIFCAIVLAITSHSQDRIKSALDSLRTYYPQEKTYILYDKAEYVAGETMWFSAFVFSGYEYSMLSTNLFIELYDSNKNLLIKKQLPVFKGQTFGQLELSPKLAEGIYYVHAYTSWMLNFPQSQYIHPFIVYNPNSPMKIRPVDLPWKVSCFVEGRNLVDGITSKLAVRLSSASSVPSHWSGKILEKNSGQPIADFKSDDPNIGKVEFIPKAGSNYLLVVEDEKGRKQFLELPAVEISGVSMKVENLFDSIVYTIHFKDVSSAGYRLIGTMSNEIIYEANIKKEVPVLRKSISTNILDNGILQLTVFDPNNKPVAERLCFVNPTKLDIKSPVVAAENLRFEQRAFNKFEFASDTLENPYSILVMDADSKDPLADENFLSALWFSSDISFPVQNAAQYFSNPTESQAQALDNILITEKWKDFNWEDILNGKFPAKNNFDNDFISYKGTVFRNKKLVTNEDINIVFKTRDSSIHFSQVRTDSLGCFYLKGMFFYDTVKIFYQLNSKKSYARDITIKFENLNRPVKYSLALPTVAYQMVQREKNDSLPETVSRSLQSMSNLVEVDNKYKTMAEVTVKTKVKSPTQKLNEELSSGLFTTMDEKVFDFVNEDQHAYGYQNILLWLDGRVAGYRVEMRDGEYVPIIRNSQVAIYVDEMPIDPSTLTAYPISDIAMVKVIKGFFVGGFGGGSGGGAIAIYTRKAGMNVKGVPPALNSGELVGYERWKDYPVTNYQESYFRTLKKDTREVLFWQPMSTSSNDQLKVSIDFYNNDLAKKFRLIILGITPGGLPIYYNSILK